MERVRARLRRHAVALRSRYAWLGHADRAGRRYVEQRGNHFAAAVTFFSLVAAVPLLMIALGVAGYALALHPSWFLDLETAVVEAVPPEAADVVLPLFAAAVEQRDTVTGLGVPAALWAGVWWMSNLREAVSAQWRLPPLGPTSVRRVLLDLAALSGLALALACSVAGSVAVTAIVDSAMRVTGVPEGRAPVVLGVFGALAGLAANWVVLLWITARLPRVPVPWRRAATPALLGAVGVSFLELSVTAFLGSVVDTPGGAVFGSLLGVLLFLYLVSRLVLVVAAWTATSKVDVPHRPAAPATAAEVPAPEGRVAPGAVAFLLSGVLIGLVVSRRGLFGRRSREPATGLERSARRPTGPAGRRRSERP